MSQLTTLYEINKEANSILIKQLGLAKTIRFLNQFSTGKGDYSRLKEDLFQGKSVQEIAGEIRENDSGTQTPPVGRE
jgi:hypothetical protein